jgi:hypothetical protein
MISGAQTCDGQFVEVSWCFHGILISSRVFFSPPGCSFHLPGILGAEVDDSWRGSFAKWLYLVAKPSHLGGQYGWPSLPFAPTYDS